MPKLVVKKHRPIKIAFAVLLLGGLSAVIVWFTLDSNHWNTIQAGVAKSEESRRLWNINKGLEKENELLKDKVIMLESSNQIDDQTAIKLQENIRDLQAQVHQLTGELEFYQGIMNATTDSKGLNVQGLRIEATAQPRSYRFKLVLTNVGGNDRVIDVTFDMSIYGMDENVNQVLSLNDVISGNNPGHELKFRNFKRIEGNLVLPEGFKPFRVVVDLKQKGLNTSVQREFDWSANAG